MAELWRQCAAWLRELYVLDKKSACFEPKARVYDLALALQDGVILCELANKFVPKSITSFHMDPVKQFLKMQNINAFLEVAPKLGVKSGDMFDADELYYASDFPKVINCLVALSGTKVAVKGGSRQITAPSAGGGGDDLYHSLEDLVGQSISFQESAAVSYDSDGEEEDVYGSIMKVIGSGGGGGGDEEDVYGALMGSEPSDSESIYSVTKGKDGGLTTRDRVLAELEDTEARFVGVLNVVIDKFMRPLALVKQISKMDHKTMFSNVTDLLTVHTEFHGHIKKQMASTTGRKLSEPFMLSIPKMSIYGQFCCDVPKAMEVLTTLMAKKDTAAILENAKRDSAPNRFSLKDLLNVPMQRVLKYPLLLKELIKHTAEDHRDHPKLMNAKAAIDNLAERINKTKSDHDTLMGMIAGLTGYSGAPLQQYAPFVKDGDIVYKDCKSSKKDEKKLRVRYGFLLREAMVLTEPKKTKYAYKSLCLLNKDMKIVELPFWSLPKDEQNSKFSFAWAINIGTEQMFVFCAKTLPVKKQWVTAMTQLIDDMQGPTVAPDVGVRSKPIREDDLVPAGKKPAASKKAVVKPQPVSQGYEQWTPSAPPPKKGGGAAASPRGSVSSAEGDDAGGSATEDQWFAGKMGRPKAEKLFGGTPDSTFLIRESDTRPGDYSLSVKYNGIVKHIKVNRVGDLYEIAPDAKGFSTIQAMVEHFRTHSLNRHFPGMETTLAKPFKIAIKEKKANKLHGQTQSESSGIGRARSRFAYTARSPDELTFDRGIELTILSTNDPTLDPGWWKGSLPNGQIGIFPANYVQQLG